MSSDAFYAVTLKTCTHLRIVHEKVAFSSPSVPQTSAKGGTSMPKEKTQTKTIIRKMLVRE